MAWLHSTTRTSMTTFMLARHRSMRTPATTSTERRAHFLRLVLSCFHPHAHMHFVSSLSLSCPSPWPSTCVRSLHLDPPFLLVALPSAPFPLPQLPEVCGKPAQLSATRVWTPLTSSPSPHFSRLLPFSNSALSC